MDHTYNVQIKVKLNGNITWQNQSWNVMLEISKASFVGLNDTDLSYLGAWVLQMVIILFLVQFISFRKNNII